MTYGAPKGARSPMTPRAGNRYATWDPVGSEVAYGRRDAGRPYTCRGCNRTAHEKSNGDAPDGWYHLRISGRYDDSDVAPGYYCGVECLAVGALRIYGMSDRAVRGWLRSGSSDA